MARAGISSAAAAFTRSGIRTIDSVMENSVKIPRCTKCIDESLRKQLLILACSEIKLAFIAWLYADL